MLHQVIADHLDDFLRAAAEVGEGPVGEGTGLPQFVEREFRDFLRCGVFEAGFARFRCEGCARERLVLLSLVTMHDPVVIRRILAHLRPAYPGSSSGPSPPEHGVPAL